MHWVLEVPKRSLEGPEGPSRDPKHPQRNGEPGSDPCTLGLSATRFGLECCETRPRTRIPAKFSPASTFATRCVPASLVSPCRPRRPPPALRFLQLLRFPASLSPGILPTSRPPQQLSHLSVPSTPGSARALPQFPARPFRPCPSARAPLCIPALLPPPPCLYAAPEPRLREAGAALCAAPAGGTCGENLVSMGFTLRTRARRVCYASDTLCVAFERQVLKALRHLRCEPGSLACRLALPTYTVTCVAC